MTSCFSYAKRRIRQTAGRFILIRIDLTVTRKEMRQTLARSTHTLTSSSLVTTMKRSSRNRIDRRWLGDQSRVPVSKLNRGDNSGSMLQTIENIVQEMKGIRFNQFLWKRKWELADYGRRRTSDRSRYNSGSETPTPTISVSSAVSMLSLAKQWG